MMKSWYLIQTKPRQETVARDSLQHQGYHTYLPLAQTKRRRRGKAYILTGPMFPLYLFIKTSSGIDDWGTDRHRI